MSALCPHFEQEWSEVANSIEKDLDILSGDLGNGLH